MTPLLKETGVGRAGVDRAKLEGILGRVDHQTHYNDVQDIFEIAAWYGIAIAKGHGFVDANKRTGLAVMLTYLELQGVTIRHHTGLDDMMVSLVESQIDHESLSVQVADYLFGLMAD